MVIFSSRSWSKESQIHSCCRLARADSGSAVVNWGEGAPVNSEYQGKYESRSARHVGANSKVVALEIKEG